MSSIASQNAASASDSSGCSSASVPGLLPPASPSSSPPHAPSDTTDAAPIAIARHVQLFRNVPPTVFLPLLVELRSHRSAPERSPLVAAPHLDRDPLVVVDEARQRRA